MNLEEHGFESTFYDLSLFQIVHTVFQAKASVNCENCHQFINDVKRTHVLPFRSGN